MVTRRVQLRYFPESIAPFGALRLGCLLVGLAMVGVSISFYVRASWAVALLPWPEAKMSYIFLASLSAAACASLIWIGITGEVSALADMTIDTVATYIGSGIYLFIRSIRQDDSNLMAGAFFSIVAACLGAVLFQRARRLPDRDRRPTPALVRYAYLFFASVLVLVGSALVAQIDHVFPWNLRPETSTLFGVMFFGSAVYYFYGWWRGTWAHAAGQLWAFLAYDLVLFTPYIKMLFEKSSGAATSIYGSYYGTVASGDNINDKSLIGYLFVLSVSTALAIYCFGFRPGTRIRLSKRDDSTKPMHGQFA